MLVKFKIRHQVSARDIFIITEMALLATSPSESEDHMATNLSGTPTSTNSSSPSPSPGLTNHSKVSNRSPIAHNHLSVQRFLYLYMIYVK